MTSTIEMLESKVQNRRHNHFSRDDFFTFVPAEGRVSDWNGGRNLLVSEDFIIALQRGFEAEAGPASALLMYTLGENWGKRDAQHFRRWFEAEYETTVEHAKLPFTLETWWWSFTAQGWGKWEVDFRQQSQNLLVLNLFDSAVAKTLGNVGKPVCHLYAGLFAGFLSAISNRNLSGIEIQCYGMGETHCKFMIGSQERINAAEFWLGNGVTAKEIMVRSQAGEMQ